MPACPNTCPLQRNISLKSYNTFGVDYFAHYFFEARSSQDIDQIVQDPFCHNLPKLILGGGSNILFTQNYSGIVIKNSLSGIETVDENDEMVYLRVGAGENWHQFVQHCLNLNYAGVENLSLIPGTVGAAPMQNIGAYGTEIKDVFHELQAVRIQDGKRRIFSAKECEFDYRHSIFKTELKNQYIVESVTLYLYKQPRFNLKYARISETVEQMGEPVSIHSISNAVIKIRQEKLPDPKNIGNAGSFFKNPIINFVQFEQLQQRFPDIPHHTSGDQHIKIPAAWLIEQCGWRGKRCGTIGVYDKHALVIVNYGHGSGKEIQQLAEDIQDSVYNQFQIILTPEVNIY